MLPRQRLDRRQSTSFLVGTTSRDSPSASLRTKDRRSRRAAVYGPLLLAVAPVAALPATAAFVDHAALFHLVVAALLVARRQALASLLPLGAAVATKTTAG